MDKKGNFLAIAFLVSLFVAFIINKQEDKKTEEITIVETPNKVDIFDLKETSKLVKEYPNVKDLEVYINTQDVFSIDLDGDNQSDYIKVEKDSLDTNFHYYEEYRLIGLYKDGETTLSNIKIITDKTPVVEEVKDTVKREVIDSKEFYENYMKPRPSINGMKPRQPVPFGM